MPAASRVAIIGLGRFGLAAAAVLIESGHDVIGIDRSESVVQESRDALPLVVQAQLHEQGLVRELGLHEVDAAVVAIGDDTEANIFITALLVEAGVRHVVARAHTPLHGLILERVGAHRVVYPESEAGEAVARTLRLPVASQHLSLAPKVGITQLRAAAGHAGRSVAELQRLTGERLMVLVIQRGGKTLARPSPEQRIEEGDVLVVLSDPGGLDALLSARQGQF
jgi:trk system potassium uptake protein TrkA